MKENGPFKLWVTLFRLLLDPFPLDPMHVSIDDIVPYPPPPVWRDSLYFTKNIIPRHFIVRFSSKMCKNVMWHFGNPLPPPWVIWWHCRDPLPSQMCHVLFEWPLKTEKGFFLVFLGDSECSFKNMDFNCQQQIQWLVA
jgi:hypothetical protein